ncbi:fungal specific transcription factor domain-containing protein [Aspergillus fischeri NRRL 181]|uniref:Xylanolytic transcriptional activator regulatory domain-containing protein n=1 Tax=Neosartorya fischeri (strain ATCC 1020 / DSM 3700 / CBS 544.65 / FGSC A1164 / JCM 1740 / NRRL 181 / WB 181) TaxID=331117 RepID=A1CV72_NEOFI|nr:uncharacterized protein NFIA_044680 [Aspergillus fischeri NRRL 181]EAW25649.1 predicted protein [Aspergillus fischeri NRRL 181]KAG2001592.1 hypothetical protein GB937_010034 [Aspergillus fischeri]
MLTPSRPSPRDSGPPRRPLNGGESQPDFHPARGERSASLPELHEYAQVSAVELTDQLFHMHDQGAEVSPATHSDTSALPGGAFLSSRTSSGGKNGEHTSLAAHFPGLDLPSRPVCDFLLDSYWRSVHWFMMIFHDPSFKQEYRQILDNQFVTSRQEGTAVLILMVLAMGARYAPDEQSSKIGLSRSELLSLQEKMLNQVRSHFFDVLDTGGVECVQLCILLSTYYLYNGKPNLAMPILGAGVRSAQAQGLHKENLWGPATEFVFEVRKRTWWALYVLDRFASITYGRPPLINDTHCAVSMPRDIDDCLAVHPLLSSTRERAAHSPSPATLGAYQRHKFELYTIAGPIIGIIYDLNESNWRIVVDLASQINTKLVEWFDRLPMELKLESHVDIDMSGLTGPEVEVCQLFHLQALVLQLAYDNIQIILHRPFLRYDHRLILSPGSHSSDARPTSFEQCKHCARRTCSILPRHTEVLLAAQNTHAAAYIAIQNFTAGVTLGMVALSDPGSEQALDAKRGVANSISLQRTLARSSVVPSQTVMVLEGLFQLIFKREMQTLLGDSHLEISTPRLSDRLPTGKTGRETYRGPKHHNSCKNGPFNQGSVNQGQETTVPLSRNISSQNDSHSSPEMDAMVNSDLGQDAAGLTFYSAIDEALESVQQVLWENSDPIAYTGGYASPTGPHFDAFSRQRLPATESTELNNLLPSTGPMTSMADPASQGLNSLNNSLIGQGWVWNPTDFF